MTATNSLITTDEFIAVLREGMPSGADRPIEVVRLEHGDVVLRVTTGPLDLRPGGTVSGPVLFWLADLAMYAAVMSVVGVKALVVTTDATLHFLRRPRPGLLVAHAHILKSGQRLVVGEVSIAHDGEADAPVAHGVMSYSIPPA